ncbi:MAG: hypothetical protein WC515_05685 [Candidatus Omnitrophota bacterium]
MARDNYSYRKYKRELIKKKKKEEKMQRKLDKKNKQPSADAPAQLPDETASAVPDQPLYGQDNKVQ